LGAMEGSDWCWVVIEWKEMCVVCRDDVVVCYMDLWLVVDRSRDRD